MSLSHALLGMLALRPASGYELAREFEQTIGRYAWRAGHTSIYPELGRLADKGLIEVTHEGARGSRTYAVTPTGYEQLRDWLLGPPDAGVRVRNETVLRMFLITALEPPDARRVLERIAEHAGAEADELRAVRDSAPVRTKGKAGFGRFALEYGIRANEATRDWAVWGLEQLA